MRKFVMLPFFLNRDKFYTVFSFPKYLLDEKIIQSFSGSLRVTIYYQL
jgi:hypothetical protein